MKLQPDRSDVQSITGYGPGWVGVGAEKISRSVVVSSRGELEDWPAAQFEDLGRRSSSSWPGCGRRWSSSAITDCP